MGKCFQIEYGLVREGIALTKTGRVEVGDTGRGRFQTVVNPPQGAVVKDNRLMEVPGRATVVLIRDHSGYRGSWRLAEYAARRCPLDEQPVGREHDYTCPVCGYRCSYDEEKPLHNVVPAADVHPSALGKLIAEGRQAQGAAGRMGGGPEYLVALRPGAKFSIRRWGRLYGRPSVLNVEVHEDGLDIQDAEAAIRAAEAEAAWE